MGGWGFFGDVSVTPAAGQPGDTITINNTGSGFFGSMIVAINGVAATSITVVDHQTITCVVPAGGSGDVYIENPDGEHATITDGFIIENVFSNAGIGIGIGIGVSF